MKKLLSTLLVIAMVLSCATGVFAYNIGDIIGMAQNTDIVAYINNYAIPSYAVNGTSVIVAEDLRNFGFDVIWDNYTRTLSIWRNNNGYATEMNFTKTGVTGSKCADLLATDIAVFAGGYRVTSYAINGYTMIPIEELTMLGRPEWVAQERAINLWVDGLYVRDTKQYIVNYSNQQGLSPQPQYTPQPQRPVVTDSFDTLKNFLIANGEYDDGDYELAYYDYENGTASVVSYDSEDNTIGFISVYNDGDSDVGCVLTLEKGSSSFEYFVSAELLGYEYDGMGSMPKNNFADYTQSVSFAYFDAVYDTPEIRAAFGELGASGIKLALAGAAIVLAVNGAPVTLSELGFTAFNTSAV